MRYQTRQVLDLAEIKSDTLRHWKKNLPPIADVDGRSGQYTPSQLVCICAIASAVTGLGVPISRFSAEAEHIFDSIDRYTTDRQRDVSLVISASKISFIKDNEKVDADSYALIRLNPIWDRLQNALLSADPEDISQATLPFGEAN